MGEFHVPNLREYLELEDILNTKWGSAGKIISGKLLVNRKVWWGYKKLILGLVYILCNPILGQDKHTPAPLKRGILNSKKLWETQIS